MEEVVCLGKKVLDIEFFEEDKFDILNKCFCVICGLIVFLIVQEGCDKFCVFCVVFYICGVEVLCFKDCILIEVVDLVVVGVWEIILFGQNVNVYYGYDKGLVGLIWDLVEIDGLDCICFIMFYFNDMDDVLIEVYGICEKLMLYLYLLVQLGSDKILKVMNCKYMCDEYFCLIDCICGVCFDFLLLGDFIVGFFGEID